MKKEENIAAKNVLFFECIRSLIYFLIFIYKKIKANDNKIKIQFKK